MVTNIITIVAEISLVLILFFLINWIFDRFCRKIFLKIPLLKNNKSSVSKIRRNFRSFLILLGSLLSLVIISINGFLIYRDENVKDYSLQLINQIPQDFWAAAVRGIVKSVLAILAMRIVLRIFNYFLDKVSIYTQNIDKISNNDESIAIFFKAFKNNINNIAWIAVLILCAQFLILPSVVAKYLYILLKIYAIVTIGLLIFKVLAVIIDSLDALSVKYSNQDNLLRLYQQLRYLIPFLKRCLEYIIYVVMATLILQQIHLIANIEEWGKVVIKSIAIFLTTRILISIVYVVVDELLLKANNHQEVQQQSRQTITPLIKSTAKYLIYFGAGIAVLNTVGIDPTPILAGAGIVGLAVGLGAQNLVNDIVSGFFILFENYYLVGDYVETDEASGYVEAIELRTTRIRHRHGQVYIVRNGDITSITNYSKEFVYAVVDIGVDYDSNLDRVYNIIENIGRQFQEENNNILESTQVEGVEEFGDIRLSIHTKTKVKPGKHLTVEQTLRKLFKEAFDREGIYIPIGETTDKPNWVNKVRQ